MKLLKWYVHTRSGAIILNILLLLIGTVNLSNLTHAIGNVSFKVD